MNGHEFTPVDGVLILTHADGVQRVCIDPESREQVRALYHAYLSAGDLSTDETTDMQAALRSLIAPPKPEEPTGLGAVVEDSEGVRWVRYAETAMAWMHWRNDERDTVAKWSGIDAVRVLSEGVTA